MDPKTVQREHPVIDEDRVSKHKAKTERGCCAPGESVHGEEEGRECQPGQPTLFSIGMGQRQG